MACGGETPFAPSFPAASFDESTDVLESVVIEPDYGLYTDRIATQDASLSLMAVEAAAPEPAIRIGVVEAASAVHIGATGAWTLRDRATGMVLRTGNGGGVTVTLASISQTFMSLQVSCSRNLTAIADWKARAEAAGHPAYTRTPPGACTSLFIGNFPVGTPFPIRNAYRNQLIAAGLAYSDSFWPVGGITIGGGTIYRVTHAAGSLDNVNPVIIEPGESSLVTIGTSGTNARKYRGTADVRINGSGSLAGINELPMEQYLYGVVPRELGPRLYPEVEAQKAQAVAARTYAMSGRGKRIADGYDLRATQYDQVYGGYQDEQPLSTAAIDATRGVVARYEGKLIDALYSSASGGHTANAEEAYTNATPYLRGVPDAERGRASEHVPSLEVFRAHANPTSLRAVKESDFETEAVSLHRWTYEWTAEGIRTALSLWKEFDVGRVDSIKVLERGPSGRALRVEYYTASGTYAATKGGIRTSLLYQDAAHLWQSLRSTLFFIEPVTERGQWTGGFRVYGGGFGHGVGMSQTGAVGMASMGYTYDQILHHYYQGITLAPAY